ncbi:hypothetical protein BOW53_03085 [Solemya pervernicosa gill symbiont]|uniref:DUF4376 domain-containing protein n=1 Tax=Solemya pervernicosa gill symbiont TaxID=642797 RepID=A0A1T2L9A6_9GAMM|nr:DUF4376 domain-containing protein [Solemya pervernicosa gill symbiont]OOZ41677.1 hypothetical protein BOW53_03085 [Solemya pervernicosa gill symbiont]
MPWILLKDGKEITRSNVWNPHRFNRLTGISFQSIEPATDWSWNHDGHTLAWEAPAPTTLTLDDAKEHKREEIRAARWKAEAQPVNHNGIEWHGGRDSAALLHDAYQLADVQGEPATIFTDTSNTPHLLELAEALQVVIAVGNAAQEIFRTKQQLMNAIDDATTIEAVEAIAWPA